MPAEPTGVETPDWRKVALIVLLVMVGGAAGSVVLAVVVNLGRPLPFWLVATPFVFGFFFFVAALIYRAGLESRNRARRRE